MRTSMLSFADAGDGDGGIFTPLLGDLGSAGLLGAAEICGRNVQSSRCCSNSISVGSRSCLFTRLT